MSADSVPQSFLIAHPWLSMLVGVCAVIIAVTGAWRAVLRVTGSSFDDAVMQSVKRKTSDLEHHLRHTVFKDDFEARQHTDKVARSALRIGRQNAQGIKELLAHAQQTVQLGAEVPQLSKEIASVARSVERVEKTVQEVGEVTQRLFGVVDEMRRHSGAPVSIPPGTNLPVGRG